MIAREVGRATKTARGRSATRPGGFHPRTKCATSLAGKRDPLGRLIPQIALPANYSLDDPFQSLDLRLSRTFLFGDRWRVSLVGEVFNLYDAANLSGYSSDLTSSGFGQPAARFTQLFGSGGPRAFQVALRVSF